jgi:hypothetical protein
VANFKLQVNDSNDLWENLRPFSLMSVATEIEIKCKTLQAQIPMKSSWLFRKALKRTENLNNLMIQETKFDERDWTNVSQGLIEATNITTFTLELYRSKITKKNLRFISEIMEKAKFPLSIGLLHISIENSKVFDILLDLIKKYPQLESFTISKDSLTAEQLTTVMNMQNILCTLKINEPEIVEVTNLNMKAKVLFNDSEFIWMNEKLPMLVNHWQTKNLLYLQEALYASKHLKTVLVTDSMPKTMKILNGAFQTNTSIKKLHIVITKRCRSLVAKLSQRKNMKITLVLKCYDYLKCAIKQLNNMDLDSGHGIRIDFKVKEDHNFEILLSTSKLLAFEVLKSKITPKLLETLKNHQSIRSLRFSSSALDTHESVSLAELILHKVTTGKHSNCKARPPYFGKCH